MRNKLKLLVCLVTLICVLVPSLAWADAQEETSEVASSEVEISADGEVARLEGSAFAVEQFSCSRTGSSRSINDQAYGYTYSLEGPDRIAVVNTKNYAVLFVPTELADAYNITEEGSQATLELETVLNALDENFSTGVSPLKSQTVWHVVIGTVDSDEGLSYTVEQAIFTFGKKIGNSYYITVTNEGETDGSTVKNALGLAQMGSCTLAAAQETEIIGAGTPLEQLTTFLGELDYSPLWITLKTSGCAIIIVFFLGLAAAYFTLRIPKRLQDIFDTIFTIPMVLPPTVCGFLLLMLLGRNTAIGQFFINIGFPLFFSWQATVVAAVVVSFPLMYRSARGAFESLDPNMLDAARTLGWSNRKIFVKIMMPLAWSSIASGTVLAFARALGEFGCTLFLAGNQLGSTRTIPIAIYFEWMNGNQSATWFWTIVLIIFSFFVILFINVWSGHTTRYRQKQSNTTKRSQNKNSGGSAPRFGRRKDEVLAKEPTAAVASEATKQARSEA